MKCKKHYNKKAFSIIELSIVLVVIGLLSSTVIFSKSVIESAKIQSLYKEQIKIKVYIDEFIRIYNFLPGDIPNAVAAFGGSNGDGNSKIEGHEIYQFWLHVYLANLMTEKLTGVTASQNPALKVSELRKNIPASKIFSRSGYVVTSKIWSAVSQNISNKNLNVIINLSEFQSQDSDGIGLSPALTPMLMRKLDRKFDDELPYEGEIIAIKYENGKCNTSTSDNYESDIKYLSSTKDLECIAVFPVRY